MYDTLTYRCTTRPAWINTPAPSAASAAASRDCVGVHRSSRRFIAITRSCMPLQLLLLLPLNTLRWVTEDQRQHRYAVHLLNSTPDLKLLFQQPPCVDKYQLSRRIRAVDRACDTVINYRSTVNSIAKLIDQRRSSKLRSERPLFLRQVDNCFFNPPPSSFYEICLGSTPTLQAL